METRKQAIEVADLLAVAHSGEDLVVYMYTEENYSPSALCVEANFDTLQFSKVQPLANLFRKRSYEPIFDIDAQIALRHRIVEEMGSETTEAMLKSLSSHYKY